jgi:CheY-like chemotaxis protein
LEKTRAGGERTIVIIEDNPADIVLVRETLDAHRISCDLQSFANGEDAVSKLLTRGEHECPDLILLDWNLPALGGADVLRAIRQAPGYGSLPVAILTSSGSPRDRAEALRLGATRYIQKPLGFDEFVEQVGNELRNLLA